LLINNTKGIQARLFLVGLQPWISQGRYPFVPQGCHPLGIEIIKKNNYRDIAKQL
jgi:hypothetical protein